jgi:hypothetical protein
VVAAVLSIEGSANHVDIDVDAVYGVVVLVFGFVIRRSVSKKRCRGPLELMASSPR